MPTLPKIPSPPIAPLDLLLDRNLVFSPEYQGQLTNHLPMALHALHQLGATPQRLQEFYDGYCQRLITLAPVSRAEAVGNWQSLRGHKDSFRALMATFTDLIEQRGVQQVLRESLPLLMPGVAAAAFHGVIRTAHAVESGHRGEIAAALAYWALRWQALDAPQTLNATLSFDSWAQKLLKQAQMCETQESLISIRMEEATHSSTYQALAVGPVLNSDVPGAIARLAALAAQFYVNRPDFTVLHMITCLRALRLLLPWMDECEDVQALLMRAFTAAYVSACVLPLPAPSRAQEHTWLQVIDAAKASNNDHVIKLVHACLDEAKVYGEGSYLQVARLAVR
jgi:hypothetical protein